MAAAEPGPASSGASRIVRMEHRFDASAERAFRAWTDPEELGRWLADGVEGGLAVGARTVLLVSGERVWWEVTEVHPNDTFAFRHPSPSDEAIVTPVRITVQRVGYGCRVQLEDGPFAIDGPGGLDAWASAIRAWAETLTMLRAYLDFSIDVRPRR